MQSLIDNPLIQLFRAIIQQATEVKELMDTKEESGEDIIQQTKILVANCDAMEAICPEKVLRVGYYKRHIGFIKHYLSKNKPYEFYGDIKSFMTQDLFVLEEAFFHYLTEEGVKQNYFDWEAINPLIQNIAKRRFEYNEYGDAVRAAFIEINDLLKKKYLATGGPEIDGVDLMRRIFTSTPNNNFTPIFPLSDNTTVSGRNIQDGYMQIFAGAMAAIRNPNAHENIDFEPNAAWDLIVLASHLTNILSRAEII